MKNILGFFAIAFFAITFVSCEKDYVCTCTSIDSTGMEEDVVSFTPITAKKSDAEDTCAGIASIDGTITTSCVLEKQ